MIFYRSRHSVLETPMYEVTCLKYRYRWFFFFRHAILHWSGTDRRKLVIIRHCTRFHNTTHQSPKIISLRGSRWREEPKLIVVSTQTPTTGLSTKTVTKMFYLSPLYYHRTWSVGPTIQWATGLRDRSLVRVLNPLRGGKESGH